MYFTVFIGTINERLFRRNFFFTFHISNNYSFYYIKNGNICYKYVNATVVPGTTTYTCPDGYTKNGTSCTRKIKATTNTTTGSIYYTCDKGGTYNQRDNTCYYNATYKNGSTSCKCPSGYNDNGSNCVRTTTYSATYHAGSTTYGNCPSGFSPVSSTSNQCVKNANVNVSWSNPQVITSSSVMSEYNNGTTKVVKVSGPDCKLGKGCTYTYYKYTATKTYSCPTGNRSGDKCYTTRNVSTTSGYYTCNGVKQSSATCYTKEYKSKNCTSTSGAYTCPNGGRLVGSTCVYNATYHKNSDTKSYSCPAGYTLSGKECIQTIRATEETTQTKYTCPTGYVQEGTTCYQYTEPTTKRTYKYTCPEGYTKNGEGEKATCTKEVKSSTTYYCENENETLVDDKCRKVVKGGLRGYTCPVGYITDKDKCVKKTLDCADLQEITNTTTTYEYTWSSESSLDGWTQTGKTRNNNVSENLYEK